MTTAASPCAALLLTGGASRRFGSPKAEIVVEGVRLADRLAALCAAIADPVLEVGPGYSSLEALRESPPGAGPLVATAAGADALVARGVGERPVLVVAVDLAFLERAVLELLRDDPAPGVVVPMLDGRRQPLCARYPSDVATVARGVLDGGARSMRALLDAYEVHEVSEAEWTAVASRSALTDVDTPEDAARSGIATRR